MSTAKALVVRFLGSLTVHRKSVSSELDLTSIPPLLFVLRWYAHATSEFLLLTKKIGVC